MGRRSPPDAARTQERGADRMAGKNTDSAVRFLLPARTYHVRVKVVKDRRAVAEHAVARQEGALLLQPEGHVVVRVPRCEQGVERGALGAEYTVGGEGGGVCGYEGWDVCGKFDRRDGGGGWVYDKRPHASSSCCHTLAYRCRYTQNVSTILTLRPRSRSPPGRRRHCCCCRPSGICKRAALRRTPNGPG